MIQAAVIGGAGYAGVELYARLSAHPEVGGVAMASRTRAGERLEDVWPQLRGVAGTFVTPDVAMQDADVVFLATPHGQTAPLVHQALAAGKRVIDLSADSRLNAEVYAEWYGPHPHPEDLLQARYGLVEAHRRDLDGATLVAAPGCNATSMNLALLPLAEAGLLTGQTPVCHVVTGSSGAGRNANDLHHFPELNENVLAYKAAGTHRHTAEVEAVLGRAARQGQHAATHGERDESMRVTFTPHLAPLTRGIHASCVVAVGGEMDHDRLQALYRDRYDAEPLVRFADDLPHTKSVAGSDLVHVAVRHDARTGMAHAFATIDNLGKGAAGQAVQGFNVAFGFPETAGLRLDGMWP